MYSIHVSPDLEAAVTRDVDISYGHPGEEDGGDALLAPEDGGAGAARGQAAQLELLPRLDLRVEIIKKLKAKYLDQVNIISQKLLLRNIL